MRQSKPDSSTLSASAAVLSSVVCGIGIGILIALVQVVTVSSHSREYERIQLGMSHEEVSTILRDAKAFCGSDLLFGHDTSCVFADPWRSYRIKFDSEDKRVTGKSFAFSKVP